MTRQFFVALLLTAGLSGLRAELRAEPADRADRASSEYAIKAFFTFNVANFVEWPASAFASATAPLRVAVVASHPLPEFAAALQGKSIRGHAVVVEMYESADQIGPAHVIFVTADGASQLRAVLKMADHRPVLTMIEQDADTPGAAVVSVGVAQARLAFSVNLDAADAASLQMNPNLLKLAKTVQSARVHAK